MISRLAVPVVFVLGLVVSLGACRDDSDVASPTPTPITAQEVLQQASQRFEEVDTLHFRLELEDAVALDQSGTLKLGSAEGDLKRPDQAEAKAMITFASARLTIEMVSIGDDQYITNPVTGRWEKAPEGLGYNPAVLFNEEQGIAGVLRNVHDAQLVGSEEVSGRRAHHVRGEIEQDTIQSMVGTSFGDGQIGVDLWIAEDTKDLLKVVLEGGQGSGESESAQWTLTLSDQNEPVTIERPDV